MVTSQRLNWKQILIWELTILNVNSCCRTLFHSWESCMLLSRHRSATRRTAWNVNRNETPLPSLANPSIGDENNIPRKQQQQNRKRQFSITREMNCCNNSRWRYDPVHYTLLVYTTQVNSTFRARWLASSEVITQVLLPPSSRRKTKWLLLLYFN